MPCIPGKVVSAREAMDDKCTFEMVEQKSPYSQSRVKIEGRMGSARRRSRRGGALTPGECISKQKMFLKAGQGNDAFKKSYPECNFGARRRTRRGGALSASECITKQAVYLKAGQGTDAFKKQYPECAYPGKIGSRRRSIKKSGRSTRRR